MKGRSPIKIALSIIFTFVLTLFMVAVSPGIAFAGLQSNPDNPECSTEIIQSLEKFVKDMGETAEADTTLGSRYLHCDNYTIAQKRYNKAIKLAEPGSKVALYAQNGLVKTRFSLGEINENERDTLIKEISSLRPTPRQCSDCFDECPVSGGTCDFGDCFCC